MVLKLYGILSSPAVRSVWLCVKALKLEVEWIEVNLLAKEHLEPSFLKLNPQHTVPVLDDDGFIIVDSHVIMAYLVAKYGENDSLYPKDLQLRSAVDHRLHFDSSVLFIRGGVIARSLIFEGQRFIPKSNIMALEEAFNIIEKFLENKDYVTGNQLTIADFSIVTTITSWSAFVPVTEVRYPKISRWIKRLQALPYYQEGNQEGLDILMDYLKDKIPQ